MLAVTIAELIHPSLTGVSLFLPTILRGLYPGRTTVQIQLLSVGPYCVAFVWTLFLCFLSARLDRRGVVLLISSPFAIAGKRGTLHTSRNRSLTAFLGGTASRLHHVCRD